MRQKLTMEMLFKREVLAEYSIPPLLDRITIQPGLMGGKPTIRGLRFPVSDILELLSSGLSESEIIEQYPILEREDIAVVKGKMLHRLKNTRIIW